MIRLATPTDAATIATIYNHYIRNTVVTFEETEIDVGYWQKILTADHQAS